jgi:hypothetical protein
MMGSYFKPLRRKIGLATLFAGLVISIWWVASFVTPTRDFPFSHPVEVRMDNQRGVLAWAIVTIERSPARGYRAWNTAFTDIDVGVGSFRFSCMQANSTKFGVGYLILSLPHWSIVIPLTLLSAWLLLSKPHFPKAKSPVDPVSEPAV